MPKQNRKGHVEFRQPAAKLTAEMPEDDAVREQLEELTQQDGFSGGCAVLNTNPDK